MPDLPSSIRLGCKWMAVANTLAYYNAATVMPVKGFIVQGLEVTHYSKVLNSKCYT